MTPVVELGKKKVWIKNKSSDKNEIEEIIIADNDAIFLFICFYKLMFLGTSFSKKMLKLKFEKDDKVGKIVIKDKLTDDEGKSDSAFSDMNDFMSSDVAEDHYIVHEGSVQQEQGDPDPYQKIK